MRLGFMVFVASVVVCGAATEVAAQPPSDGGVPDAAVPPPPAGEVEPEPALREEEPTSEGAEAIAAPEDTSALEATETEELIEEDEEDEGLLAALPRIDIHAFVSQGFLLTTDNDYLANGTTHGSFEFTEIGLNFTTEPIQSLRLGVQLFARDLGPIGNYEAKFDWFYADYRFADWLGLRVGRTKLPFGLYNEENDVDVAHTPILLPQSIYPTTNRDFLLAQTGGELYGLADLGDGGRLDYRAYGGTIFLDFEDSSSSGFDVLEVNVPYLVGGRLLWETPLEGLRAGGSVQALRLETDILQTGYAIRTDPMTMMDVIVPMPTQFSFNIDAILWVASVEYAAHDLLVAAEYSRWHVSTETSDPMLFPSSDTVSERLYLLVGYRFTDWFQASAYYALMFPNIDDRNGRDSRQQDYALTARFDINEHWLVKLEGHFMNGTAGLSSQLNDNVPLVRLTRDWAVILLKTTAYF